MSWWSGRAWPGVRTRRGAARAGLRRAGSRWSGGAAPALRPAAAVEGRAARRVRLQLCRRRLRRARRSTSGPASRPRRCARASWRPPRASSAYDGLVIATGAEPITPARRRPPARAAHPGRRPRAAGEARPRRPRGGHRRGLDRRRGRHGRPPGRLRGDRRRGGRRPARAGGRRRDRRPHPELVRRRRPAARHHGRVGGRGRRRAGRRRVRARPHVVVAGIGVRPAVDWLAGAGIDLHNGVVADEHLRTSLPGVVAVGDCAAWWSRRYGQAAGRALGHRAERPRGGRRDPAGRGGGLRPGALLLVGAVRPHGPVRGPPPGRPSGSCTAATPAGKWSACWLTDDDTLAAVLAVDRPRDLVQGRRIIEAGHRRGRGTPGRSTTYPYEIVLFEQARHVVVVVS